MFYGVHEGLHQLVGRVRTAFGNTSIGGYWMIGCSFSFHPEFVDWVIDNSNNNNNRNHFLGVRRGDG